MRDQSKVNLIDVSLAVEVLVRGARAPRVHPHHLQRGYCLEQNLHISLRKRPWVFRPVLFRHVQRHQRQGEKGLPQDPSVNVTLEQVQFLQRLPGDKGLDPVGGEPPAVAQIQVLQGQIGEIGQARIRETGAEAEVQSRERCHAC